LRLGRVLTGGGIFAGRKESRRCRPLTAASKIGSASRSAKTRLRRQFQPPPSTPHWTFGHLDIWTLTFGYLPVDEKRWSCRRVVRRPASGSSTSLSVPLLPTHCLMASQRAIVCALGANLSTERVECLGPICRTDQRPPRRGKGEAPGRSFRRVPISRRRLARQ
jgi:hypothetical protein